MKATGFWSYVRADDEYENGKISRLRERLERSVRFHSGLSDFAIFQDKNGIGWGEDWSKQIAEFVDEALILFAVVTPSYFMSDACKGEIAAFQERQRKLHREDLILPIYYLSADAMLADAPDVGAKEAGLGKLLRDLQYEDFRSSRITEETDPSYAQAVERLGARANAAIKRGRKTATEAKSDLATSVVDNDEAVDQSSLSKSDAQSSVSSPAAVKTFSVHQMPGRGEFTSINEAIKQTPAGSRIAVYPGHYRETLLVDKPLELIGVGPAEDIVIESVSKEPIIFDTNIGLIRNFTIRRLKSKEELKRSENQDNQEKRPFYGVWIRQGQLELEDCDITSAAGPAVCVSAGSDPRIRRCKMHNSRTGLLIASRSLGTYEDNELFGNYLSGVALGADARPVLRRNLLL